MNQVKLNAFNVTVLGSDKSHGIKTVPGLKGHVSICHKATYTLINDNKRLCYGRGTAQRGCEQKFCNYKTSHLKSIVWHYLQMDGHTTTAYTALSIASLGKNRP